MRFTQFLECESPQHCWGQGHWSSSFLLSYKLTFSKVPLPTCFCFSRKVCICCWYQSLALSTASKPCIRTSFSCSSCFMRLICNRSKYSLSSNSTTAKLYNHFTSPADMGRSHHCWGFSFFFLSLSPTVTSLLARFHSVYPSTGSTMFKVFNSKTVWGQINCQLIFFSSFQMISSRCIQDQSSNFGNNH